MTQENSRRRFLKTALMVAGGTTALFANLQFDANEGVKIGRSTVKLGMSEAHATCGSAYNCGGGGGQCGSAYECSGGGGKCGSAYNCSGGGGKCGSAYECAGQ